ncbi:hypothetical protein GCM10009718_00590 [Isoptericola halotolerans]
MLRGGAEEVLGCPLVRDGRVGHVDDDLDAGERVVQALPGHDIDAARTADRYDIVVMALQRAVDQAPDPPRRTDDGYSHGSPPQIRISRVDDSGNR